MEGRTRPALDELLVHSASVPSLPSVPSVPRSRWSCGRGPCGESWGFRIDCST